MTPDFTFALALALCLPTLVWFVIVLRFAKRSACPTLLPGSTPSLTLNIFKPIPPAAVLDPSAVQPHLESFVQQLRPGDRLLLGLPSVFHPHWNNLITHWRLIAPQDSICPVTVGKPDPGLNPKIAKLRDMAGAANQGFWVWSDADITAAPGTLDRVRTACQLHPDSLITHAYLINDITTLRALPDAVVVNLQLNPGIQMLAERGKLTGAVGALGAFHSRRFLDRLGFEKLSRTLADDYALGRELQPVVLLTSPALHTPATGRTFAEGLAHAFRWQRTIRWCDPRGAAGQILIHPLVFLAALAALAPSVGLLLLTLVWCLIEGLWARQVFRQQGCQLTGRSTAALAWTAPLRTGLWLAAWLPLTVHWGSSPWTSAEKSPVKPTRSWRTLLAGLGPWMVWWGLTPVTTGPSRALAALTVWWITQALDRLTLKPVDAVFAIFFIVQIVRPLPFGLTLNALLTAMAAASLLTGRPFTLAYAREETEPEQWTQPGFLTANTIITSVWLAAFAANLALAWSGWSWPPLPSTAFMALPLALAALFTKVFPRWYRSRMETGGTSATEGAH